MKKRSTDINKDGRLSWNELDVKDKIAYVMACVLIVSGIIMAFACFFMRDDHDITKGVLYYCAQSFVTGGALLGIGIYIKGKFTEISNMVQHTLHPDKED